MKEGVVRTVALLAILMLGTFAQVSTPLIANADSVKGDDKGLPSDQQALLSAGLSGPVSSVPLQMGMITLVGKSKTSDSSGESFEEKAKAKPFHAKDQKHFDDAKTKANSGILQKTTQSQAALTASPAPIPSSSFFGFDGLNEVSSGFFYPPDVQVATGTSHVMEMVNLEGKIWTKTGTSVSSFPLKSFFLAGTSDFLSDPKVLYDSISGRWFASLTDITRSSVLIAVSSSGDPTGIWNIYSVSFGSNCADQPILGISDDKIVVSANDFSSQCSGSFIGAQYFILDKSAMVAGSSTIHSQSAGPDPTKFSVHPVHSLSSTSTLFMVSVGNGATSQIQLFSITGSVPSATVNITPLTIQTVNTPPDSIQLGSPVLVATGDSRILDAEWFQGNLWATFTDGCVPSGDTLTRSCIHLVEISTAGTTTVIQDFKYGTSGIYYFYPALAADSSANLDLVFGFSSSSTYPSVAISGQSVGQTTNTLIQPLILKSGMKPDTSGRYGDYFGAAVDPSNPSLVWAAGEYHSSAYSSQYWSSSIGTFSVPLILKSTTLTLNPVSPSSVPWGKSVTITGKIINSTSGAGIGGKTITFTGTGAAGLSPVITNPDGTFSVTGVSPSLVQLGLTVQAHFAGDSSHSTSDSNIVSYNTNKHKTALTLIITPSSVTTGNTYQVSGTLTDTKTSTTLSSMTISFSATSPITIPSTTTGSTGNYLVSGLTAPGTAGSYNITSQFSGTSLYGAVNSAGKTLSVTSTTTSSATTLTLNPITSVPWSSNVVVTGKLTATASDAGVGGKIITFSGNGTSGLSSVTTNSDGTFSVTGPAPSTVATGWQVNANFAGDSSYSTSSATQSYDTLKHNVSITLVISPSSVVHGGTYSVSGTLADTTTGTALSSKTISFTATSPITIPNTVTNSTGNYLVSGLTAPGTAGSYNIVAKFNGGSFYKTYSATRTLSVI